MMNGLRVPTFVRCGRQCFAQKLKRWSPELGVRFTAEVMRIHADEKSLKGCGIFRQQLHLIPQSCQSIAGIAHFQ